MKKVSDKLVKVGESFTVNMYDNGYMLEVSGKDKADEWSSAKLIASTVDELVVLLKEITTLPRD
jgi:hypothetical protein